MTDPIRVLIVDDSKTARALLAAVIGREPDLEVAGEARDGVEAVAKAAELRPDIITMDVTMPEMDGLTATHRIMQSTPTPVVIVSATYDPERLHGSFDAVQAGALHVIEKPSGPASPTFRDDCARMVDILRELADVDVASAVRAQVDADAIGDEPPITVERTEPVEIVAIAGHTGGPPVLARILGGLAPDFPVPILITQDVTAGFEAGLAEWLDSTTELQVGVAAAGLELEPGYVVLAPGGAHLGVSPSGHIRLLDDSAVDGRRPSATRMFESVSRSYDARCLALQLTGGGTDGVTGLRELKLAGGSIIAQDPDSAVVASMPRAAIELGLADHVLPPEQLAGAIEAFARAGPVDPS